MNDLSLKENDGYYKNKSSTSSKDTDSSVFQNSMMNGNQDEYATLSYASLKGQVLKTTNTIQCDSNTFDVNSNAFKTHLRKCKECKRKQMEINIQHQTMINTINDIKNSLIITSSIIPPTNNPPIILYIVGLIVYCSKTQVFNDPNINLSPGNRINAPIIVIIIVVTIAFLSILKSFHKSIFLDKNIPIPASIIPYSIPY